MFVLIIAVIFGLGIASFAIQNTAPVSIQLAQYTIPGVPLYGIAIGALLLGLLIAYIISMVDAFSSILKIHGKENALKEAKKTIAQLAKQLHELELENARLNPESKSSDVDDRSL